ncbi:MAG: response regulator [Myxococcales bacterium]|nr:response regulator [Myxococcales bacterium]
MTDSPAVPVPRPRASSKGPPARVLVIDDSQTILKVTRTILELNGYGVGVARDGQEGLEALQEQGPFDMVLLDFVMPRMNGYQFCRKLRADEQLKNMPVVLMSARTQSIGARFVEQTGAVDALDKPFDARALVAVVGSVLEKQGKAGPRELPRPDQMVDEEELASSPESMPPPSRHLRGVDDVASVIAKAITPYVQRLSEQDLATGDALQRAITLGLGPETLTAMAQAMDQVDVHTEGEILRGELDKMPLAEILQLLQLRRQTGSMRVRHGKMSMVLSINDGVLDLAQSDNTDDEFRLGRYLVEAGAVTREELEKALAACPSGTLLGDFLVAEGIIDENQRYHALAHQSAELVYEVLRWPEGRFILVEEPPSAEAEKAALGLGLSELVLEGFRRVDEWRLMADTIDFDAVLIVDQVALSTLDDSKIGPKERPVLDAIDGKRTAREVMQVSEVASFDAIKAIYGLLQARVVREAKSKRSEDESSGVFKETPRPSKPDALSSSSGATSGELPKGDGSNPPQAAESTS